MKLFKFFIKKIFLRKIMLTISILLLLFMANYVTFIAVRSNLSTLQGYQEIKAISKEGNYIGNLDVNSDIDMNAIKDNGIKIVYDYLDNNFDYAFYTDGFVVPVPNDYDMDIPLSYMNKEYYNLNQFELSQGKNIDFNYEFNENKEIPVLIGKGLSETYPIGSLIQIEDPMLGRASTLKVQGILKEDTYHSNFNALNSKYYYNFSTD